MANIIRFPRKGDPPRMYSPYEISDATGVSYDMALWICKNYGVKMKRRYYITMAQYDRAVEDLSKRPTEAK